MASLTAVGLQIDTQEQILADIQAKQLTDISTTLDISSASPIGQLNGIISGKLREIQELVQAVYKSYDPDAAEGQAQDQLYALTGVVRKIATYSRLVGVQVNLNAGVTLPQGSVAQVLGNQEIRFASVAAVTNPGGAPATVTVDFIAEQAGPIQVNTGALTEIATPVSGWNTVYNPTDALPGANQETKGEFRARREIELAKPGTSPVAAIRADISEVPGVISVTVFENSTDSYDVDGIPPHSIEAVIYDAGAVGDAVLAERIFRAKAGGIRAYGSTVVTHTDEDGNTYQIGFTRPTNRDVWLTIDLYYDPGLYSPSLGSVAVKSAIAASDLLPGQNVYRNALAAHALSVAGVKTFGTVLAGLTMGGQIAADILIGPRDLGILDTARIVINAIPATP